MTGLEHLMNNCDHYRLNGHNQLHIVIKFAEYLKAEDEDRLYRVYNINKQVEILQEVLSELMTGFESPEERMDFILDIVNGYKKRII